MKDPAVFVARDRGLEGRRGWVWVWIVPLPVGHFRVSRILETSKDNGNDMIDRDVSRSRF